MGGKGRGLFLGRVVKDGINLVVEAPKCGVSSDGVTVVTGHGGAGIEGGGDNCKK